MKFCLKCKNTGRILEQRLSEYVNSFDYYPAPCPDCQSNTIQGTKNSRDIIPSFNVVIR